MQNIISQVDRQRLSLSESSKTAANDRTSSICQTGISMTMNLLCEMGLDWLNVPKILFLGQKMERSILNGFKFPQLKRSCSPVSL